MNYSNYSITELQDKIKAVLPQKRFLHTLGVAYTSASIGFSIGYKENDLLIVAGLLHDCAKCFSDEEQIELCEKNEILITEAERKSPFLLHGKLGAFFAKTRYGVSDKRILMAIEYHSTGRPNMTLEEKIIFISDYIEPSRDFCPLHSLEELRSSAYKDINLTVKSVLENMLHYFKQDYSAFVDPMTEAAYEFYREEN